MSIICPTPCDATKPALMYICPEAAAKAIAKFIKDKHHLLSRIINKPEECYFYFTPHQFEELYELVGKQNPETKISGLRIFFASYVLNGEPENDRLVPAGKQDCMTLIFVPTTYIDGVHKNIHPCVHLNPVDGTVQPIGSAIATEWVNNYLEKKHKPLSDKMGKEETKSMWYPAESLVNLFCVIRCQQDTNGKNVSKVLTLLSAYPAQHCVLNKDVGHQLTLTFTLMEELVRAGTTYLSEIMFNTNDALNLFEDYDTGIPCPPSDACDDNLPPPPPLIAN